MKTQDLVDQILRGFVSGRLCLWVQPKRAGWVVGVYEVPVNDYLAPDVAVAFMDMWASEVNRPLPPWEA